MKKAETRQEQAQSTPAARNKGIAVESPRGEQISQLEAMIDSSPQMAAPWPRWCRARGCT
jgi:hypothetical protein